MKPRSQLLINNTEVDLFEDIPVPLNLSVVDIREPQKRTGSWSKTVTIPGSKINNKLFTNFFDVNLAVQTTGATNFTPDFNPNLKADAVYFIDTIEQFSGIAQLTDVRIIDDKIEYDLVLKGRLADIFTNLGDSELTDLDLSEFDHAYTRPNQILSLDSQITENGSPTPFELGKGYVYPLIDYGFTDGTKYSVRHFFPAIYVKQYIDKLFAFTGFTFTSNFFDSTYFKELIIPFNSDKLGLNKQEILDRSFRASRLTTDYETADIPSVAFLNETVIFNDDSTGDNFDTLGVYNTANGEYILNASGDYELSLEADVIINWGIIDTGPFNLPARRKIEVFIGFIQKDTSPGIDTTINFKSRTFTTDDNSAHVSETWKAIVNAKVYRLRITDKLIVRIAARQIDVLIPNYTATAKIKIGSVFFNRVANNNIAEGNTLLLNNAIPRKIKLKDFFIWIIKMFNLYIEPDKQDSKKLHIEPRDDWYASGTTVDWSSKLSKDRETIYKPMGELTFRKLILTYAEDKDYFNTIYKDIYDRTYGDREIDVTNDFLTETLTNSVGFASTPLVQLSNIDRFVSKIISLDKNGLIKSFKSKLRILFYKGLKTTNSTWVYNSDLGNPVVQTNYGYAGHLDDPDTPTEDLNFGVPREVFYRAFSYTNNNLFNKYHKQMIDEITDPNAKLVTAWFNLKPTDILTLDFRDKFFFEGQFYRLNRVIDYNPIVNELTKCEFIKIIDGIPFVPENPDIVGGNNETLGAVGNIEVGPLINYPENPGDNTSDIGEPVTMIGEGNTVGGGSKGFIVGDGNFIGSNVSGVTILGSSGTTVFGGLRNVNVINSSGQTVTNSNTQFINNVNTEFLIKSIGSVAGAEADITATVPEPPPAPPAP